MPGRACVVLLALIALAGCASTRVAFPNVTPGTPLRVPGWELRPDGDGPFPAVVLLHTCHGVSKSTHAWARWFRDRRYVALIVDSWAARGIGNECDEKRSEERRVGKECRSRRCAGESIEQTIPGVADD